MNTAVTGGVFADGASFANNASTQHSDQSYSGAPSASFVDRAHKAASRVRTNEGLRGYSVRTQVWVRYIGYFLLIAFCTGCAKWSFSAIPAWRHGGEMLLYSVATILVVATIGSVLYAEARDEIQRAARQYAFGIVALPAAALSVFMRPIAIAVASHNAVMPSHLKSATLIVGTSCTGMLGPTLMLSCDENLMTRMVALYSHGGA